MKKIIKGVAICIAMAVVYMLVNGLVFSVLPFSEWFKEGSAGQETNMVLTMVYMLWIVGTMYFVVDHARCKGIRLYLSVVGCLFFIQSFMTQIETILFNRAFVGLGRSDIFLMMLGELVSISITVLFLILILKRKSEENETESIDWKCFIKRMLINGLIYMVIYFVFGYFVAWKSEDLRVFYSGSPVDAGFLGQLYSNLVNSFIVYPFQFVRGMLFTIGIIPLMKIKWKHKNDFIIGVCAVFLCTAVGLLVPNFLFPDTVRLRHLVEMVSSMTLFGIITAKLMEKSIKMD